ncbi:MAG: hypothetical protein Q7V19_03865 [Bacteroidales bacterium]|nr:hypothetical protein [Bacteroidales bacterium]
MVVVLRSLLRVGFCSGGQVSGPQIRYCGYTRNVGSNSPYFTKVDFGS